MQAVKQMQQEGPFLYHLFRNAMALHGKGPGDLEPAEYRRVEARAHQSYQLESRVLDTPEAHSVVISERQLDEAMAQIESRYASRQGFLQDLQGNHLDEALLRQALHRELLFDAVLQQVAGDGEINDVDVNLFYELHHERFIRPEQRSARHILITINSAYAENSREAALLRAQQILADLAGRSRRFGDLAARLSECPTAMDGGKLGDVTPGQLYPELDAALFALEEGGISDVIESELGFHILLCEKIRPARRIPLRQVLPRIRETLLQRQRHSRQKAWLERLQSGRRAGQEA